jgi:hypothetical protein
MKTIPHAQGKSDDAMLLASQLKSVPHMSTAWGRDAMMFMARKTAQRLIAGHYISRGGR